MSVKASQVSDAIVVSALPFSYHFDLSHTALVVIDMQNDFCCKGGFGEALGNDVSPAEAIIPKVQSILSGCRALGMTIIHTREGHLPDLSDCPESKLRRSKVKGRGIGDKGPMGRILIRGEYGHDIVDVLQPFANEWVIDKPGKGAFYNTNLEPLLKSHGIESLILTGVTTHVCVHTTLREANDRGYECLVLEDATAAYDIADHEAAIRMVHQQGAIFGWVSDCRSLLEALAAQ
jgi:nicotinamidase-related amidase